MTLIDAGSVLMPGKTMFKNNYRLGEITKNNGTFFLNMESSDRESLNHFLVKQNKINFFSSNLKDQLYTFWSYPLTNTLK